MGNELLRKLLQFDQVDAVFRPKDLTTLKPDAAVLVGKRFVFRALWLIDEGPYSGQWALMPDSKWTSGWVPEEDLADPLLDAIDHRRRADALVARIWELRRVTGTGTPQLPAELAADITAALRGPQWEAATVRDALRWSLSPHELSCFLCGAEIWDEGLPELHAPGCIVAPETAS